MPALKRIAYTPLQTAVRTCAGAADVVIATDRSLVDTVQRHLDVPRSRIETVPNAVDLEAIDRARDASPAAAIRSAAGLEPGELMEVTLAGVDGQVDINSNDTFTLQIQPPSGSYMVVERTTPASINETIINLN